MANDRIKLTLVVTLLSLKVLSREYVPPRNKNSDFAETAFVADLSFAKSPHLPQFSPSKKQTWNNRTSKPYAWESRLLKKLFTTGDKSYNREIRPAKRKIEPVVVTIEFVLRQINDLLEKSQQIAISGFLKITWIDERLLWEPMEFGGIEWVVVGTDRIWLPDIALVNSESLYGVTRDGRFPITVTANGEIFYVPAGKIYARCNFDLRYFPFDYQLCKYRFESWVYSAELVTVVGTNFTVDTDHYIDNHQWAIIEKFVKTSIVKYEDYNFSRVEFYLLLKRKSIYFVTYTIFPCMALSWLQIFSHMLPFTEKERINFATTTLISFSVFHVAIVETMPKTSHAIPLLAVYIDGLMCLIGLSLIECFVMMTWLTKVGCSVPSPHWWRAIVERCGSYLLLGANCDYWRRNYLRIYNDVTQKNLKLSEQKEQQSEPWKRYSTTSNDQRKESFVRKCSKLVKSNKIIRQHAYRKASNDSVTTNAEGVDRENDDDIAYIIKIAQRWGWRSRRSSFPAELTHIGARNETDANVVEDMEELDAIAGLCLGDVQSSLPFRCTNLKKEDTSGDDDSSASFGGRSLLSHISESCIINRSDSSDSFMGRLSAIKIVAELCRTYSDGQKQATKQDFLKFQNEWRTTERQLTTALNYLKDMAKVVRQGLAAHNLKRECIQIWTIYIMVIDRILSAILFIICACMPIVLFVLFPKWVPVPPIPAY